MTSGTFGIETQVEGLLLYVIPFGLIDRRIVGYKVFIQASGLACEVYVEVSPLRSLSTTVCEVADSVVCQVAMLPSFNSL